MVKARSKGVTPEEKLDHKVKVLLKEWAGLSGFYGYKDKELDEIFELVNTEGWKTTIDASDPSSRVLVMERDAVGRKAKFSIDDKGRAIKNY